MQDRVHILVVKSWPKGLMEASRHCHGNSLYIQYNWTATYPTLLQMLTNSSRDQHKLCTKALNTNTCITKHTFWKQIFCTAYSENTHEWLPFKLCFLSYCKKYFKCSLMFHYNWHNCLIIQSVTLVSFLTSERHNG